MPTEIPKDDTTSNDGQKNLYDYIKSFLILVLTFLSAMLLTYLFLRSPVEFKYVGDLPKSNNSSTVKDGTSTVKDDNWDGSGYLLQIPMVVVKVDAEFSEGKCVKTVSTLSIPSGKYQAVSFKTTIGSSNSSFSINDGWMLTNASVESDNTEVIKQLSQIIDDRISVADLKNIISQGQNLSEEEIIQAQNALDSVINNCKPQVYKIGEKFELSPLISE